MKFKIGELRHPEVVELLQEHHRDMLSLSPPESVHALDLTALEMPNITFISVWIDNRLAGVGALKELENGHGEIKSMRTAHQFRGQSVASKLLSFLLDFAKEQGYDTVSLETGTQDYFLPARSLYEKFGFLECGPFSDYKLDPNSYFMTRDV